MQTTNIGAMRVIGGTLDNDLAQKLNSKKYNRNEAVGLQKISSVIRTSSIECSRCQMAQLEGVRSVCLVKLTHRNFRIMRASRNRVIMMRTPYFQTLLSLYL